MTPLTNTMEVNVSYAMLDPSVGIVGGDSSLSKSTSMAVEEDEKESFHSMNLWDDEETTSED